MRVALPCGLALLSVLPGAAATPNERFDAAVRHDLEGRTALAYESYLGAAESGLPEAEFNVAAMLDSGRGVPADAAKAAVWYARSAAHGNRRAAYNLAQLYEAGEGVPRNPALARAWFDASHLPARAGHLARLRRMRQADAAPLAAPTLLAPAAGDRISPEVGGVELVWTAAAQPGLTQYFVEVEAWDDAKHRGLASATTDLSSLYVRLPSCEGACAWRVTILSRDGAQYAASEWRRFTIGPDKR